MENSSNLGGKTINPIIDFDFIANTELGLIRFIRDNFQDDRAFKLDILNKSDREILSLLYSRSEWNPLSIITTEENRSDIDGLLKSFFDTYKKEIIKLSISEKAIISFIKSMIHNGINFGIYPVISVSDDIEQDSIIRKFGNCTIVKKDKNLGQYVAIKDAFYIKDYRFFISNGCGVSHKIIYTTNRFYNLEYFKNINSILTRTNEIKLIGKDYHKEFLNKQGESK